MKSLFIMLVAITAAFSTFAQKANTPQTKRNVVQVQSACSMNHPDQSLSKKEQMKAEVTKASFNCPMHKKVVSDHVAKCPDCKPQMVVDRRGSKQIKKDYTCSMQPDVASNNPGKCPICNLILQESNTKVEAKKG
jgi:Heavy metal binding domain